LPTLAERYHGPEDLPRQLPVFPLRRVILLPRAVLPLIVFEPRYLRMIDDVLATARVLGVVQPATAGESESPLGRTEPLRRIGCVGRLTSFQEADDGRLMITLTGIARCTFTGEIATAKPYRLWTVSCQPFLGDFATGRGEGEVDRERLLKTLKSYLRAQGLKADWPAISKSSNEALVNALSLMSPYGPEEKQALLEAPDLKTRAEVLVALAEMELAAGTDGSGSTLQ
jgi:Lon protease-like protein